MQQFSRFQATMSEPAGIRPSPETERTRQDLDAADYGKHAREILEQDFFVKHPHNYLLFHAAMTDYMHRRRLVFYDPESQSMVGHLHWGNEEQKSYSLRFYTKERMTGETPKSVDETEKSSDEAAQRKRKSQQFDDRSYHYPGSIRQVPPATEPLTRNQWWSAKNVEGAAPSQTSEPYPPPPDEEPPVEDISPDSVFRTPPVQPSSSQESTPMHVTQREISSASSLPMNKLVIRINYNFLVKVVKLFKHELPVQKFDLRTLPGKLRQFEEWAGKTPEKVIALSILRYGIFQETRKPSFNKDAFIAANPDITGVETMIDKAALHGRKIDLIAEKSGVGLMILLSNDCGIGNIKRWNITDRKRYSPDQAGFFISDLNLESCVIYVSDDKLNKKGFRIPGRSDWGSNLFGKDPLNILVEKFLTSPDTVAIDLYYLLGDQVYFGKESIQGLQKLIFPAGAPLSDGTQYGRQRIQMDQICDMS